jgi:hypothetical protein
MPGMSKQLRDLAADFTYAAQHVEHAAGTIVHDEAMVVEAQARSLNLAGGVAMVTNGETHAEISSTKTLGVLDGSDGGRIVPSDIAAIAGRMSGELADVGVALITKGRLL